MDNHIAVGENRNLRNALTMSKGSWLIFVQRPICLAFILLTFLMVFLMKRMMSCLMR